MVDADHVDGHLGCGGLRAAHAALVARGDLQRRLTSEAVRRREHQAVKAALTSASVPCKVIVVSSVVGATVI